MNEGYITAIQVLYMMRNVTVGLARLRADHLRLILILELG